MKAYIEPTIKIYEFDTEEILTASGGNQGLIDNKTGGNFDGGSTGDEVIVFPTSADGGIHG